MLSLACGLAILLAGGVLLVRIVNQADVVEPSRVGETVQIGDMLVVVDGSSEAAGRHVVEIRIGGVDDPDGTAGFQMIASGRPAPLVESCGRVTEEVQSCTLTFEVNPSGEARQLFYYRGDQRARWDLAGIS